MIIQQAWRDVWADKDRRPIYDWAADNVKLSPPLTKTGPFDVSTSRHFIAIFDALQNDFIREVNCLKPVRGGGTLIGDVWMPWTRVNEPGPFMFVLQTAPIADDHFQKILTPTIESVPEIKRQLDALDRHKVTATKIEFSDGNHLHVNGPSIGNLQTNAFRYMMLDECWMYDVGRMADAEARVGDFVKQQRSKIFRVSQGGPKEGRELNDDDWNRAYHAGKIHEWQVPCLHCGKMMDGAFTGTREDGSFWGLTWDNIKTGSGDWDVPRALETIRFECQHCGQPMLDGTRTKSIWNNNGAYRVASGSSTSKVSFHWESVIDYPWRELVELWLEACNAEKRGDLIPKIQFYQKRRAMFMNEEQLLRRGLSLRRAAYVVTSDWADEKDRYMSIDRQEEDMFWWSVRAWSDAKSRRLGFGKAYGFQALETIREKFKVQPNHTFIDSRYLPKGDNGVYAACIRYGWIAVMGDKEYSFPHRLKGGRVVHKSYAPLAYGDPAAGGLLAGRRHCPLIRFSKAQMNQKVQELIDSGAWEEPQVGDDPEMEKEYNTQMSARVKRTEYSQKDGSVRVFWKESKNDHARDLANQQVLGAILSDLLPDPAMEILTTTEKATANEQS